jgi:phage shock protein A
MWHTIRRFWKYLAVKLRVRHEERADPKVQLEQAIQEAREQHKRLTEQAANVIANQKQAQGRLDRAVAEYEKANASARQALLLADQEDRKGDADAVTRFEEAAEVFAGKLVDLEPQIRELERQLLQSTTAAETAKEAVAQNASALQNRLAEREQLLSTLDQARMHESMNQAVAQLTATIGEDIPTFEEVRNKIQHRLARAQGVAELQAASSPPVDARLVEIEQAQKTAEARSRLAELRTTMGLPDQVPPRHLRAIEAPEA